MNTTFTRDYKNCTIDLIVEDDTITTAKVILDGEIMDFISIQAKDSEDGLPVCAKNIEKAFAIGQKAVDVVFDDCLKELGLEPVSAVVEN